MELTPEANTNILLESIDLNTKGIIWVAQQIQSEDNSLINELDYFFDGTITSGVHHHQSESNFSLFTTNNFGRDLKLGMIPNNNKFSSYLSTFLDLVTHETTPFKVILIQQKEDKNIEKLVSDKLSKFKNSSLEKLYF
jgi:hypothetical protein